MLPTVYYWKSLGSPTESPGVKQDTPLERFENFWVKCSNEGHMASFFHLVSSVLGYGSALMTS